MRTSPETQDAVIVEHLRRRQDGMNLNLQRACGSSIDAAMHLVSPALATKADIVPGPGSRNRPNRTFLREALGKRLSSLIARLALIAPLLILYASPARTHHSWAP